MIICQDIFQDIPSEKDGTEVQSKRVRIPELILSQNALTLKIMFAPKNGCYINFASYNFMYVFKKTYNSPVHVYYSKFDKGHSMQISITKHSIQL